MTIDWRYLRWAILAITISAPPSLSVAQKALKPTERTSSWPGKRQGNQAPVIGGTPATAVAAGSTYSFTPVASDPNGDSLTFTISNRPAWAVFSTASGKLQGTPQAASAGTYSDVVISVSDGKKSASLAPFAITVTVLTTTTTTTTTTTATATATANTAPTITGTPSTTASQGTQYVFQPTASDADGDPLTFTIANRPTWATFNGNTGALIGTPGAAASGTYGGIVISVSDGKIATALPAFAITVAASNIPPTLSGTPPSAATVGTEYSFTPTANDANGDPLTFSIVNRPAWATFTTSTGRLQGTPAVANLGTVSNIVISVSDGQSSAQLPAFSITVSAAANTAPTITGIPATSVVQGTLYTFQPAANDGDGDVLTFGITNKPPWATFSSSTGQLRGTPGAGDVGTTSGIVITVSDGQASNALPAFNIAVEAIATGSATLSWQPPTQNTDGSALANLAGFKVYWGPSQGVYPNSAMLTNPGLSSYVVENLVSGTYFFVVTAVNTSGVESQQSNLASKTIP